MERETHTIIIVPIGLVIAIIFGIFLVTVGGLTGIKMWFEENLSSFIQFSVIFSVISAIICTVLARNVLYGLSGLVSSSQAIFFLAYGGYHMPSPSGMHLEYVGSSIWSIIVFILYVLYAFVITMVTMIAMYLFAIGVAKIRAKEKTAPANKKAMTKNKDEEDYSYGSVNFIIGIVGWVINGIVFGLLPLIF